MFPRCFYYTLLCVVLSVGSMSHGSEPSGPDRALVLQAAPPIGVNSVAVSPDGVLVATAADGVRFYDARTGTLVRVIGEAGGRNVVFSPDSRLLAAAGFHLEGTFSKPLTTLPIYDVQTGKRVQNLAGHTEWETYAVVFSPDGKLFASAGADKQVLVWELATGKIKHKIGTQRSQVTALAFSPDGASFAGGGSDRTIRIWETATGRLQKTLKGHKDWVCTIAFSPDGKTIASGTCDWAFHRGRDITYMPGRDPGCVSQLALWDTATGNPLQMVDIKGRLRTLAYAPGGKALACGIDKDVKLFNLEQNQNPGIAKDSGRIVASHGFDVTSVAFTKGGGALISGSHDHIARRTNLSTGQMDWQAQGQFEQVNAVALSREGKYLASGSSDGRYAHRVLKAGDNRLAPGAVRLWDAETGRLLRRLGDSAEQVMAVAISPDGRRVAGGGASSHGTGVLNIWDSETGAQLWTTEDHKAEVLSLAYSPDGLLVASASADGLVKLRDPATGAVSRSLPGHSGGATSIAFSADGATLVVGEGNGGTQIWDTRSGRLLRSCKSPKSLASAVNHDRMVTSVALSPDGATLAACAATVGNMYSDPVRFWDLRTGEIKKEILDQPHNARPIALSPDGSILAAGGKSIKLWDARTGKLLRELFGYLKKTQSLAFSADGRILVAGGSYGTINAWEVATGRHLVTLFAFPSSQKSSVQDDWLAYHPDGYYDGSPGVERYLAWRVGPDLLTTDTIGQKLHRPERLSAALKLQVSSSKPK